MIRHLVSWKLASDDAAQRRSDAEGIRERLEGLRGQLAAELIEVGFDLDDTEGNWDVVLNSVFASRDDLAAYQAHPAHLAAVGFVKSVVSARACVDYEF